MRYEVASRPVNVWNEIFEQVFENKPLQNNFRAFAVDAVDNKENYKISANLPGFEEEEIEIIVKDQLLSIVAKKKEQEEDKEVPQFLIRERRGGDYKRSFTLPKDADRESVRANLKDGVRELIIGKREEAKPLNIKVNG